MLAFFEWACVFLCVPKLCVRDLCGPPWCTFSYLCGYRSIRFQVTIHGILLASDFDEVCKIDSMVISDESDGHVSPPSTVRGTRTRS